MLVSILFVREEKHYFFTCYDLANDFYSILGDLCFWKFYQMFIQVIPQKSNQPRKLSHKAPKHTNLWHLCLAQIQYAHVNRQWEYYILAHMNLSYNMLSVYVNRMIFIIQGRRMLTTIICCYHCFDSIAFSVPSLLSKQCFYFIAYCEHYRFCAHEYFVTFLFSF